MSKELGECPNNTENTVCLSPSCKYKHDRVWPITPEIFESYLKEVLEAAAFYAKQKLELETQHNCPCGCGGQFIPPAEKASIETIQCSNCDEVVLMGEFGDHYCKEYQQKETKS